MDLIQFWNLIISRHKNKVKIQENWLQENIYNTYKRQKVNIYNKKGVPKNR